MHSWNHVHIQSNSFTFGNNLWHHEVQGTTIALLVSAGKFLKNILYLSDSPVEKDRGDFFFYFLPFLLLTIYF